MHLLSRRSNAVSGQVCPFMPGLCSYVVVQQVSTCTVNARCSIKLAAAQTVDLPDNKGP